MIEPSDLVDVFTGAVGAVATARLGGLELSEADLACFGAALSAMRSGADIEAAYREQLGVLVERVDAILAAWQRPH
jgi:hypothetical protein